jgi:uncharacterized protein
MSGLSRRLKQLEKELLALGEEAMLIEELDGFIAGLLVCPDLIKPGEWLPIIWNRDGGDQQPAFDNLDHINRVLGLVMEHYNDVARTLMEHPERYSPLFAVDTRNGDILWELWIDGFEKAVKLNPAAWQKLLNADADTAVAMRGMMTLTDIARRNQPRKDSDLLAMKAPENIAHWVVTLNDWRLANYHPIQSADMQTSSVSPKKVGRNDPCPCGSAKKYKKCCGLHYAQPPRSSPDAYGLAMRRCQ